MSDLVQYSLASCWVLGRRMISSSVIAVAESLAQTLMKRSPADPVRLLQRRTAKLVRTDKLPRFRYRKLRSGARLELITPYGFVRGDILWDETQDYVLLSRITRHPRDIDR